MFRLQHQQKMYERKEERRMQNVVLFMQISTTYSHNLKNLWKKKRDNCDLSSAITSLDPRLPGKTKQLNRFLYKERSVHLHTHEKTGDFEATKIHFSGLFNCSVMVFMLHMKCFGSIHGG